MSETQKIYSIRTKLKQNYFNLSKILTQNQQKQDKKQKQNQPQRQKQNQPQKQMILHHPNHKLVFHKYIDLFTLLYTSIIFKWLNSERLILIVDSIDTGYKLEIFLRNFKIDSIYLDRNNPINTNLHFASQFYKGAFPILITHDEYTKTSIQYAYQSIDKCLIEPSIVFFNMTNPYLIEEVSCKPKVKSIFHFMSTDFKTTFKNEYSTISKLIIFEDYSYDKEQFKHLMYRCEDMFHQIKKTDVQKTKIKKINQELLNSKAMIGYFQDNPDEKERVIRTINENSIKKFRPSVGFLPGYLIHENNKNSVVQSAIEESYFVGKKRKKNEKEKRKMNEKEEEEDEEGDCNEKKDLIMDVQGESHVDENENEDENEDDE